MEGTSDVNDSTNNNLPESAPSGGNKPHHLGRSGNAVERTNSSPREESDPGDAGDSEGSEITEEQEDQREIMREVSLEAMEMLVSSGPIPDPKSFYDYKEDHQERILRMAEAPRTDESRRRDKLVSAQSSVIMRSQWIQAVLFASCLGCAGLSLWVFHQPIGMLFIGLPVMQAIGAIVKSIGPERD